MLKIFAYIKKRRELIKYFKKEKKIKYYCYFMSNKEMEGLKNLDHKVAMMNLLFNDFMQVLDLLCMLEENPETDLQAIKKEVYSVSGIEDEIAETISEDTFENTNKCEKYLKTLLDIIEKKYYSL